MNEWKCKCGRSIFIDKPMVPKVAASLDDLRVGQVVACRADSGDWDTWRLKESSILSSLGWRFEGGRVVILSDPPPEPLVLNPKAQFLLTSLEAELRDDEPMKANAQIATVDAMWLDRVLDTARNLIREVRRADDA